MRSSPSPDGRALAAALSLFGLVPADAGADALGAGGDATLSADFTSIVEIHEDRDPFVGDDAPRRSDATERLELRASTAGWTAGTVLTGYGRLGTNPDPAREDVLDLEELSVGGPLTSSLRLLGGDFRPRFGRGLVLDFTSCCQRAGPAMTLRGGRADFEIGPVALTALGGTVHVSPLDPISEMRLEPRHDALAGARVAVRPVAWGSVDLHAVAASLEAPEGVDTAAAYVAGAALQVTPPGTGTALYAEVALESFVVDGRPRPGTAVLVAADQTVGPVTLLVEGKSYEQFDLSSLAPTLVPPAGPPPLGGWPGPPAIRYHTPPTLERPGEMIPADTNTLGGRATATVRVTHAVTLEAAYVRQFFFAARGDERRDFARGTSVQHPYGEVRVTLPSGVDVELGGGARRLVDTEGTTASPPWEPHAEAQVEVPVGGGASIASQAAWQRRLHQGRVSTLAGVGVALRLSGATSIGARYEYSDETVDPDPQDRVEPRRHFVSLEARGRLRSIELFGLVGSTPGGLRCLDGACRNVPPFVGARLGARVRF